LRQFGRLHRRPTSPRTLRGLSSSPGKSKCSRQEDDDGINQNPLPSSRPRPCCSHRLQRRYDPHLDPHSSP
jgi:hypothetical protein